MSEHNHLIMRTVLGVVLGFQGAKLVGSVLNDRPENYILFVAIGIAFIAVGVVFALNSIKKFIKLHKGGQSDIVTYEELKKEEAKGEDESCE